MLVESPVFPQINDVPKHIATIVANMAGGDTVDDFELEKLRAEILQEKQMK